MRRFLALLAFLACSLCVSAAGLPTFKIDQQRISVSGISSGGYMAVQFSVAYSALIAGAGVIAGGPFYCARGDVQTATTMCSCTGLPIVSACQVAPGGTGVERLKRLTDAYARSGAIDSTDHLARQRIWLFSGTADSVVPPPIMQDLLAYYTLYVPAAQIAFKHDLPAEHAMPTDDYGRNCDYLGEPYINRCNFDAAGVMLGWLYGSLNPRSANPAGQVLEFDQRDFFANRDPLGAGMAERGYVYVPAACAQMHTCSLHIAFHGCHQDWRSIGEQFVRHAGYNRWADSNHMLVLYPQTTATLANPNACWDWFNASGEDADYATRDGRQMRAVRAMIDRISGSFIAPTPAQCITATNHAHVLAGRAYLGWFWVVCALGSNDYLGFDSDYASSTLRQTARNFFSVGGCP